MIKSILILCFAVFLNKESRIYAQLPLNSIFIRWNKLTIESLNRQAELATDSSQKSKYENRILSIKEYWDIKNINDTNSNSIRFKVLQTVFAKSDNKNKEFYIIEANESGSKVLLRIFIFYIDTSNTIDVEFYDFFDGNWQETGKFRKYSFDIQNNLKNYITHFGKGFNYDDIVITDFKSGRVKESEYYLYSTLSKSSSIKNILDSYRKENFVK